MSEKRLIPSKSFCFLGTRKNCVNSSRIQILISGWLSEWMETQTVIKWTLTSSAIPGIRGSILIKCVYTMKGIFKMQKGRGKKNPTHWPIAQRVGDLIQLCMWYNILLKLKYFYLQWLYLQIVVLSLQRASLQGEIKDKLSKSSFCGIKSRKLRNFSLQCLSELPWEVQRWMLGLHIIPQLQGTISTTISRKAFSSQQVPEHCVQV